MTTAPAPDERRGAHALADAAATVHVWWIDLAAPLCDARRMFDTLSADETARAARFRNPGDGTRWARSRFAVRAILAHCTGCAPHDVAFVHNAFGKPALAGTGAIHFNLSHSGDVAALAATHHGAIGVDVEVQRERIDVLGLSARFFAADEADALRALPEPERTRAFYRCWTRKESFVKAIGTGLSEPLDGFAVSLEPLAAPRVRWSRTHCTRSWRLYDISRGNVAAAVALRAPAATLVQHRFDTSNAAIEAIA